MKTLNNLFNQIPLYLVVLIMILGFSGCEVIGGIFKAGVWVGVIMVVLIIVIIFYIMGKIRRK